MAVSGGTTPALFFEALSQRTLDWPNVTVTLVDERFVGRRQSPFQRGAGETQPVAERRGDGALRAARQRVAAGLEACVRAADHVVALHRAGSTP